MKITNTVEPEINRADTYGTSIDNLHMDSSVDIFQRTLSEEILYLLFIAEIPAAQSYH